MIVQARMGHNANAEAGSRARYGAHMARITSMTRIVAGDEMPISHRTAALLLVPVRT